MESVSQNIRTPDEVWTELREEGARWLAAAVPGDPIALLVNRLLLPSRSFVDLVSTCAARDLGDSIVSEDLLAREFEAILGSRSVLQETVAADLRAYVDRDPASYGLLATLFFAKGFQGLVVYRMAHQLWLDGRIPLALHLNARATRRLGIDIHPASRFGRGIFIDHGTGLVVGETSVIGDDVSMLQGVTLGGTGKEHGDRHPKVHSGVLLGAGAKVLGNITIGTNARVGAGSVVLQSVPAYCTAVGIPARIVRNEDRVAPATSMDQHFPLEYEI
ncbi:MAG TPA: serine O-acetyltransferase [Candidatus Baltobacteraceae bacterium]|jgi:serine O-acetyltransferase|nr:serine O-acetyltransferase [Candidatus Baltobacteraceae bacterium]